MPSEKELLDRVRYLEEQNGILQDKLDMIYAILAPDYDEGFEGGDRADNAAGEAARDNLVQIDALSPKKKPE